MTSPRKLFTAVCGAAILALSLAGCGGGSASGSDATPSDAAASSAPDAAASGGAQDGGGFGPSTTQMRAPGVSGLIADVTANTAQVQDSSSQTAVRFDDSTTVTQEVSASLTDIAVGSCVMAVVGEDGGDATSVAISEAVDGQCGVGMLAQGGGPSGSFTGPDGNTRTFAPGDMPSDMPTDMPSGMPTDMPSGMPAEGGQMQFSNSMVSGMVTAVDGRSVSVADSRPDGSTSEASFTVGDSTAVTTTQQADATAIVTGKCMSAQGESDDKGGLTARSVRISDPVDGSCTSGGMVFSGGPGGARPGQQSSGTSSEGTTNG